MKSYVDDIVVTDPNGEKAILYPNTKQEAVEGLKSTIDDLKNSLSESIEIERERINNLIIAETTDAELADIRVGANGTTYASAGDSVREQVRSLSSEIAEVKDVVFQETNYLNYNTGEAGTGAMSTAKKFIYNTPIPKDVYLDTLSVRCRYQANPTNIIVEFWRLTSDDGVYKSLECVKTISETVNTGSTGYKDIKIDYLTEAEVYCSIYADNQCLDYYAVGNMLSWGITDTEAKNVTVSSAVISGYVFNGSFTQHRVMDVVGISEVADKNKAEIEKIRGNLIIVGEHGDFTNIQDALDYLADNMLDTVDNHWTILVHDGVYPRFTTKHSKWNAYSTRYVSIIGIDKSQCIIKDDSGEYYTPPAETRIYGELKNLQFIATHDNPPSVADRENAKHKSYAIHMDMGTQKLLVEDCIFISYQAPAVGMGVWKDSDIKFKNCEFYSLGDEYTEGVNDYQTNYTYLTNHGAFFAHANMSEANGGGSAKLTLDNCRAYSKSGNKVYAIVKSEQWYSGNTELKLECINNNGWSDLDNIGSTSDIESGEDAITLLGNSFGNNVVNMNA